MQHLSKFFTILHNAILEEIAFSANLPWILKIVLKPTQDECIRLLWAFSARPYFPELILKPKHLSHLVNFRFVVYGHCFSKQTRKHCENFDFAKLQSGPLFMIRKNVFAIGSVI